MVSVGYFLTALCLSYLLQQSLCLRCYCYYEPAHGSQCQGSPECTAEEGGMCHYARYLNIHYNNETFVAYNCVPLTHGIVPVCTEITTSTFIGRCCNDADFCNQNYSLLLPFETTPTPVTTTSTPTTTDHHLVVAFVVPVVAVIVVAALVAIVMVLLFLFYVRRTAPMPNNDFNVRFNPHIVKGKADKKEEDAN